jgi:hypothetical protein
VTPELDLTPEEINDPEMMQLWLAPYGTPLPTAWNGGVDMAFRFVGMVERDVKTNPAAVDVAAFGEPRRQPPDRGSQYLTLTWRRLRRKHAAVLPVGTYCSAVFAMPAERVLGVAARVALKDFEPDWWGEGATCIAVLEKVEPSGVSLTWHAGAAALETT